ncbi:MAG: kynureninase [Halolamina sp.]
MDGDEFDAGSERARALDDADPLAGFRDRFAVPDEAYMDGNSLGPISTDAREALDRVVEQWADLGVRGWTDADPEWFTYGERLGDRLAPHVGADPEEVVVANSTTVNVHTLVGTFLDRLPGTPAPTDRARLPDGTPAGLDEETPAVLVNDLDFPSDHYAVRAQLRQRGIDPDEKLRTVESPDGRTIPTEAVADALDRHDDIGIVLMPAVLYRSGQLLDVERIAELAHDHGALVGVDCAHSVGVVPHDLAGAGVDFAVWCSYKYLNAGPGATAGLYVARRHHGTTPALAGWWGHEKETQFEMRMTFTPADGAGAWQIGTVPLLSAAPLSGALDVLDDAGIDRVREKSLSLTGYLIDLVDELAAEGYEFAVGTPREPARRGGHVAVEHPEAYRLAEALKDRGVVVDCRPPDVVRVCPAPLYTSHAAVLAVARTLRGVVAEERYREYDAPSGGVT